MVERPKILPKILTAKILTAKIPSNPVLKTPISKPYLGHQTRFLTAISVLQAATGGTNRWDAVAVGDTERTHKFQKLMVRERRQPFE